MEHLLTDISKYEELIIQGEKSCHWIISYRDVQLGHGVKHGRSRKVAVCSLKLKVFTEHNPACPHFH